MTLLGKIVTIVSIGLVIIPTVSIIKRKIEADIKKKFDEELEQINQKHIREQEEMQQHIEEQKQQLNEKQQEINEQNYLIQILKDAFIRSQNQNEQLNGKLLLKEKEIEREELKSFVLAKKLEETKLVHEIEQAQYLENICQLKILLKDHKWKA